MQLKYMKENRSRKNIIINKGFTCGYGCRIKAGKNCSTTFGKKFMMGDYCQIEGWGCLLEIMYS